MGLTLCPHPQIEPSDFQKVARATVLTFHHGTGDKTPPLPSPKTATAAGLKFFLDNHAEKLENLHVIDGGEGEDMAGDCFNCRP